MFGQTLCGFTKNRFDGLLSPRGCIFLERRSKLTPTILSVTHTHKQSLDQGRFIEALARLCILSLSRPPLDALYPTDGDRVDAVFRRVGMLDSRDLLRRLRDPKEAGFRATGVNHALFVSPPSRQSAQRTAVERVREAKNSR